MKKQINALLGDPNQTQAWLALISLDDLSDASHRLLKLLDAAAPLEAEPAVRLAFLDTVGRTLSVVVGNLEERFSWSAASHSDEVRSSVQVADRLCMAMVEGYARVFADWEAAGWLHQSTHAALGSTAIHRVMHYSFPIVRNGRLLNRAVPTGLWGRLHRLHVSTGKRLAGQPRMVECAGVEGYPRSTVQHYYKRVLLMHSLNLTGLGQEQLREIYGTLGVWAEDLDLVESGGSIRSRALRFGVDLGGDQGPSEVQYTLGERRQVLLLDTNRLDRHLVQLLMAMEKGRGDWVEVERGHRVSLSTLGVVKSAWTMNGVGSVEDEEEIPEDPAEWIDSLQLTDVRASSRRIYGLLQTLNRRDLPLLRRIEFLKRLVGPAHVIRANLRKRYGEITYPIPPRVDQISQLVDDLAQMLTEGWQLVYEDWQEAPWMFRNLHPKVPMVAVFWIFHYSEALLENRLLMNKPNREGSWLRVHRLYRIGRQEGWLEEELPPPPGAVDKVTAKQCYMRIVLLSQVRTQGLRVEQNRELMKSLGLWAADVVALHPEEATAITLSRLPFRVHLERDMPPVSNSAGGQEGEAENLLFLDVGELYAHLSRLITRGERDLVDPVPIDQSEQTLSLVTLRHLRETWRHGGYRLGERKSIRVRYQAVFSIGGIHYLLNRSAQQPGVEVVDEPMQGTTIEGLSRVQIVEEIAYKQDIWDTAFPYATLPDARWKPDADLSSLAFLSITILDYSRGGCRFRYRPSQGEGIRIGDVVSLRKGEGRDILSGYVRWVRPEESELEVGVQFISRRLLAVWLKARDRSGKESLLPGLLGESVAKGQGLLVMPVIPGIRSKELTLQYRGQALPIFLAGPPLDHSRAFEAYRFGLLKANLKLPLFGEDQVNLELLDRVAEGGAALAESRKADSVWDLL